MQRNSNLNSDGRGDDAEDSSSINSTQSNYSSSGSSGNHSYNYSSDRERSHSLNQSHPHGARRPADQWLKYEPPNRSGSIDGNGVGGGRYYYSAQHGYKAEMMANEYGPSGGNHKQPNPLSAYFNSGMEDWDSEPVVNLKIIPDFSAHYKVKGVKPTKFSPPPYRNNTSGDWRNVCPSPPRRIDMERYRDRLNLSRSSPPPPQERSRQKFESSSSPPCKRLSINVFNTELEDWDADIRSSMSVSVTQKNSQNSMNEPKRKIPSTKSSIPHFGRESMVVDHKYDSSIQESFNNSPEVIVIDEDIIDKDDGELEIDESGGHLVGEPSTDQPGDEDDKMIQPIQNEKSQILNEDIVDAPVSFDSVESSIPSTISILSTNSSAATSICSASPSPPPPPPATTLLPATQKINYTSSRNIPSCRSSSPSRPGNNIDLPSPRGIRTTRSVDIPSPSVAGNFCSGGSLSQSPWMIRNSCSDDSSSSVKSKTFQSSGLQSPTMTFKSGGSCSPHSRSFQSSGLPSPTMTFKSGGSCSPHGRSFQSSALPSPTMTFNSGGSCSPHGKSFGSRGPSSIPTFAKGRDTSQTPPSYDRNERSTNASSPQPYDRNELSRNTSPPSYDRNERSRNTSSPPPYDRNERSRNASSPQPYDRNERSRNTSSPQPYDRNERSRNTSSPPSYDGNERSRNTSSPQPYGRCTRSVNSISPIPTTNRSPSPHYARSPPPRRYFKEPPVRYEYSSTSSLSFQKETAVRYEYSDPNELQAFKNNKPNRGRGRHYYGSKPFLRSKFHNTGMCGFDMNIDTEGAAYEPDTRYLPPPPPIPTTIQHSNNRASIQHHPHPTIIQQQRQPQQQQQQQHPSSNITQPVIDTNSLLKALAAIGIVPPMSPQSPNQFPNFQQLAALAQLTPMIQHYSTTGQTGYESGMFQSQDPRLHSIESQSNSHTNMQPRRVSTSVNSMHNPHMENWEPQLNLTNYNIVRQNTSSDIHLPIDSTIHKNSVMFDYDHGKTNN